MGHNRKLNEVERVAWRTFLLSHTRVLSRLDADLITECDMTLAEYEVLSHLAEAPDRRLRMNELAELARLSPSGLTRRFDALAKRGWVTRERCDDDRRGVIARLSDEGAARLAEAEPVHRSGQFEYFFSALGQDDVDVLARLLGKVADRNAPDGALTQV